MFLRTPYSSVMRAQVAAIAAGLSVGGLLMLTAISMAFRYRIEFYPLLELGAFLGVYALLQDPRQSTAQRRQWPIVAAAVLSVIGSHCTLLLYKLTNLAGSSLPSAGFWDFYGERMHLLLLKLPDWLYGSIAP
jgi:hypothetical protein